MSDQGDDPFSVRHASGPGLPESLLWIGGYHAAQLAAALLLMLLLLVTAFGGWPRDFVLIAQVSQELVESDFDWLLTAITGSATLGALFLILPAAFWRIGSSPRTALGARLPGIRQTVLLTGAVLPLGILSDELYRVTALFLEELRLMLTEWFPLAAALEGRADTVALIQQQTRTTAYPLLLVVVGLGPAIGEEVVFRGLIGRGLIARWGVIRGVLLTSVLFAVAHVSPTHAVATLPIALFLHVAYLATRSLWAPIIVHFLNNALSVSMLKFGLGQDVHVSLVLLISAAAYVLTTGVLLMRGPSASEGVTLDRFSQHPTTMLGANAAVTSLAVEPGWLLVAAGSGVLGFTCSFVMAATGGL